MRRRGWIGLGAALLLVGCVGEREVDDPADTASGDVTSDDTSGDDTTVGDLVDPDVELPPFDAGDTNVPPGDTASDTGEPPADTDTTEPPGIWQPAPGTTWQWQLSGAVDTTVDAEVYDVDLFDVTEATLAALQADGRRVICYFSAGSHEPWRPDADAFDAKSIGEPLEGWPDERWLDVRAADVRTVMEARLGLAAERGCDAVEPDNVDGYLTTTGFELTEADARDYLSFLADTAHAHGLSIGLKNTVELAGDLVDTFDWALNESCAVYDECARLQPFIAANKAVFHVEYVDEPSQAEAAAKTACSADGTTGFSTLIKTWELDAFRYACP